MSYIKADNPEEQEYFDYLEDLRQSGDTNMFGASPCLSQAFGLPKQEAQTILGKWMRLHSDNSRILQGPSTETKTQVKFVTRPRRTVSRRKQPSEKENEHEHTAKP